MENQPCRICSATSQRFLTGHILSKYDVAYFKCPECSFIQTEDPYWLGDAYSSAITSLDVGLVGRNLWLRNILSKILPKISKENGRFLDFGSGYGLLVRMLRDLGHDIRGFDTYCENLFAKNAVADFDSSPDRYEAIFAFEVLEHLVNPMETISAILQKSDTFIFSTELQPKKPISTFDDWWYFTPTTGQHVALFHVNTLHKIAKETGTTLYTSRHGLHAFTRQPWPVNYISLFTELEYYKNRIFGLSFHNKKSLLRYDYDIALHANSNQNL